MIDHITHWVFDLDNTLYPPSVRLFDQIEAKMEAYICRELGVAAADASALRADFWHNHGTTLAGLMAVYGIDPDGFLDEVHDIDHSGLTPDPALTSALNALPGERLIYTNGSRGHGRGVSAARGIDHLFHAIYGIEDAHYVPKPHHAAFEAVFDTAKVTPQSAVMFEDDPRNLEIPATMGMITVLVGPKVDAPHIHHQTEDLPGFLAHVAKCGFETPVIAAK